MFNEVLVEDCVLKIFSYLPISDLCTVMEVCQLWEYYTAKTWAKRKHINMCDVPDHLFYNPESIKKIAESCSNSLKSLQLVTRTCYPSFEICKIFAENCPKLESLKLTDSYSGAGCVLSNFAQHSKELKHVKLAVSNATDGVLLPLFRNNRKLLHIDMSTSYITGSCLKYLPSSVQFLNLVALPKLKPRFVTRCMKKCNSISTLVLYNLPNFKYQNNFLSTVVRYLPRLQELLIGHCNISPVHISQLVQLKTLLLMPKLPMSNEILRDICTSCQQLECLNISNIADDEYGAISKSGLRSLNRLPKLRQLSLTDVYIPVYEFLPAIDKLDLRCLHLKNVTQFENRDMFSIIASYVNLVCLEITSTTVTADAMWFAATAMKRWPDRFVLYVKFRNVDINTPDASKYSHPKIKIIKDGVESKEVHEEHS